MTKKITILDITKIMIISLVIIQIVSMRDFSKPFGFVTAHAMSDSKTENYHFTTVDFELQKDNPIYLDSVMVQIVSTSIQQFPAALRITLDNGNSWTYCQPTSQDVMMWLCDFTTGFAPRASNVESIQVEALN